MYIHTMDGELNIQYDEKTKETESTGVTVKTYIKDKKRTKLTLRQMSIHNT